MSAVTNMFRAALAALVLTLVAPAADAAKPTPPTRVAEAAVPPPAEAAAPAGSPELGFLIIIGAVAFLFFVAWLVTRVGEDSSPSDGSMI